MAGLPKSLPKICVALGVPSLAELEDAAKREAKNGARFLEFRLDHLPEAMAGIDLIRRFRQSQPDVFVLATCRHKQNHGEFAGSVEAQANILRASAEAGAIAVDLEIESAECLPAAAVSALRETAALVISYHNFDKTPPLSPILRRLRRVPADVYKLACTASKPTDVTKFFDLLRADSDTPLVALAMSECGLPTRILGPSLGSLFSYAAPRGGHGTAPGQVTIEAMRALYRVDKLTTHTRVYGVVADPVAHSKSPVIHNRGFQARRFDGVYLPFRVGATQLNDWMKLASSLPVHGFSVTIPHKQRILRALHSVDPLARRIGAVNTVYKKGGKWCGTNTDTVGVIEPLRRRLRLAHATVLIAGYGGAARAAAFALAEAGAEITITGRDLRKAEALAKAVKAAAWSIEHAQKQRFDVLIHATPIGMYPNVDGCMFPESIPAALVFDMVYNPRETQLLQRAKEQGAKVIFGSEMLLEQAVRQFEIWTGESAPRSVMQKALDAALTNSA